MKIIDFGLALRKQTIETSMAARSAGNTILSDSVAGTVKYAPPEQMGEMKGVKPGRIRMCTPSARCAAMPCLRRRSRKDASGQKFPKNWHEMLEKCTEQELKHRLPSFEPVLKVLETLDPCSRSGKTRKKLAKKLNWNESVGNRKKRKREGQLQTEE